MKYMPSTLPPLAASLNRLKRPCGVFELAISRFVHPAQMRHTVRRAALHRLFNQDLRLKIIRRILIQIKLPAFAKTRRQYRRYPRGNNRRWACPTSLGTPSPALYISARAKEAQASPPWSAAAYCAAASGIALRRIQRRGHRDIDSAAARVGARQPARKRAAPDQRLSF